MKRRLRSSRSSTSKKLSRPSFSLGSLPIDVVTEISKFIDPITGYAVMFACKSLFNVVYDAEFIKNSWLKTFNFTGTPSELLSCSVSQFNWSRGVYSYRWYETPPGMLGGHLCVAPMSNLLVQYAYLDNDSVGIVRSSDSMEIMSMISVPESMLYSYLFNSSDIEGPVLLSAHVCEDSAEVCIRVTTCPGTDDVQYASLYDEDFIIHDEVVECITLGQTWCVFSSATRVFVVDVAPGLPHDQQVIPQNRSFVSSRRLLDTSEWDVLSIALNVESDTVVYINSQFELRVFELSSGDMIQLLDCTSIYRQFNDIPFIDRRASVRVGKHFLVVACSLGTTMVFRRAECTELFQEHAMLDDPDFRARSNIHNSCILSIELNRNWLVRVSVSGCTLKMYDLTAASDRPLVLTTTGSSRCGTPVWSEDCSVLYFWSDSGDSLKMWDSRGLNPQPWSLGRIISASDEAMIGWVEGSDYDEDFGWSDE